MRYAAFLAAVPYRDSGITVRRMDNREVDEKPLGFFDFIRRRQRVVSDRTWYGMALVVCSFALPWWWRMLLLVPGLLLAAWGLNRSLRRTDHATGAWRPEKPW